MGEWTIEEAGTVQCWRQLGCRLAELQRGSSMELYYAKLAEVKALIEGDMQFLEQSLSIKPTPVQETNDAPVKIADMTHRGSGL